MSSFKKEWRVSQVTKAQLNDQLYGGIDPILNPLIATPATHSKAYDAKLIIRELVDNVWEHDSAFSINLEVELIGNHIKIVIKHNGTNFDPFSPESECNLIKKIKDDIHFTPSMTFTDSAKRVMKFEFDLI